MNWYMEVLKKYAVFSGRARRKELWMYVLFDTGRTGWWWFIGFVPLIGIIVLLVFMLQDSQPGDNQYGPNPKAASA